MDIEPAHGAPHHHATTAHFTAPSGLPSVPSLPSLQTPLVKQLQQAELPMNIHDLRWTSSCLQVDTDPEMLCFCLVACRDVKCAGRASEGISASAHPHFFCRGTRDAELKSFPEITGWLQAPA